MAYICLRSCPQFLGAGADDVARHQRRGGLPERAGLHLVAEIGHDVPVHADIDGHLAAAQPGERRCGGIGCVEPPQPFDIGRQLENPLVVNVVDHHLSIVPDISA
jgi:hypothetical protein